MAVAQSIVVAASVYFSLGLIVGVPFVWWGVSKIDPAAGGTSIGFRMLILPGTVALWPLMARKWFSARRMERPL